MLTLSLPKTPKTIFHNQQLYVYATILSVVANVYKTPDSVIEWELRKESRKVIKVVNDGVFYYTSPPANEIEVNEMELQAD